MRDLKKGRKKICNISKNSYLENTPEMKPFYGVTSATPLDQFFSIKINIWQNIHPNKVKDQEESLKKQALSENQVIIVRLKEHLGKQNFNMIWEKFL